MPALNEAATLPEVLDRLHREVPWADVVVVDDGSTDETAAVARAGGATVLSLPFNLGIGGALRTGFRYAVDHGYDRAVQVDADGQHDPGAIEKLFAALDDADLVIGSRFGGTGDYEVGRTRRGAMRLLQFTLRLLSGRTFTDTSSGFRAFNRPLLEYFSKSYPSEYMESVEALIGAYYAGFRIAEVPIEMHQRAGGAPSALRLKLVVPLRPGHRDHPHRSRPPAADREHQMTNTAHAFVALTTLALILFMARMLRKHNFKSKYTLLWLAVAVIMGTLAVFPGPDRQRLVRGGRRLPAGRLPRRGRRLPARRGGAVLVGAVPTRGALPGARRGGRLPAGRAGAAERAGQCAVGRGRAVTMRPSAA